MRLAPFAKPALAVIVLGALGRATAAEVPAAPVSPPVAAPAPSAFGDLEIIRGMDALAAGDGATALALLRPMATSGRQDAMPTQARFLAARAALLEGDGAGALGFLAGLDASLPELADVLLELRAEALRQSGNWPEARRTWEKLLVQYPTAPGERRAHFGIADALYAAGELARAEQAYRLAIARAPRADDTGVLARYSLAQILLSQQRFAEAGSLLRWLAYRTGDASLAQRATVEVDRLAAAGHIAAPSVLEYLGRIDSLLAARSVELARDALTALAADPRAKAAARELKERWAELAYRSGDFAGALGIYGELLVEAPAWRTEYLRQMARAYSASHQTGKAIDTYLEVAERLGSTSKGREASFKAAWLAYNGADYARAVELFERFIARFPWDKAAVADATWYVAWNAFRLRDLVTARKTLAELREHFPASPLAQRAWYWEGRIALMGQEVDAARRAFATAHGLAPYDYYGALAKQRLRELDGEPGLASRPLAELVVDDDTATDAPSDTPLAPAADELPGGALVESRADDLPWGESALDWSTPAGRRVVSLMRLGMQRIAARSVDAIPARAGFSRDEVGYARARLLYGLGDFYRAYRLADSLYGAARNDLSTGTTAPVLHLSYPAAHRQLVEEAAREFGVSPWLILAVMRQESSFDDRARSSASAHGLMQIIPRTAARIAAALGMQEFDAGMLRDPAVNVRFGAWYLAQLVRKFHGHVALAIASYNAGPVVMERWLGHRGATATDEFVEDIPFRETRHYVKRVLGNLAAYQAIYAGRSLELPDAIPASWEDNVSF